MTFEKMNRDRYIVIPLGLTLLTIITFWVVSTRLASVLVFIPAIVISFIIYLRTFYKKSPNPTRLLPIYLLAIAIQLIHFSEEYLTDFVHALPNILGQDPYPLDYWIVFNMVAYSIFIIGGIIIFKQLREFMIIPIFFIVVGVILNSIAHIGLAIYSGGYFSGLYTALIYLFLAPIFISRLRTG